MSIEVERRAILTEAQYIELFEKLQNLGAVDLGKNNTGNIFFLGQSSQLKITTNTSKATAKVVLKSQKMGASSNAEELEIPIDPSRAQDYDHLFQQVAPTFERYSTSQKRHDFSFGGTTISLKHSEDWGYHLEIDTNVELESEVPAALKTIAAVAHQLGVALLTEVEEAALVARLIAARKN